MNAELFHELSIIAEDENLMAKVLKYVKKMSAKKQDASLMTKEEFFDRIEQASKGSSFSCDSVEELDKIIRASAI